MIFEKFSFEITKIQTQTPKIKRMNCLRKYVSFQNYSFIE